MNEWAKYDSYKNLISAFQFKEPFTITAVFKCLNNK